MYFCPFKNIEDDKTIYQIYFGRGNPRFGSYIKDDNLALKCDFVIFKRELVNLISTMNKQNIRYIKHLTHMSNALKISGENMLYYF